MKEPDWIDEPEALALHARLIRKHGGAPGIRERQRLGAALARPRQLLAYGDEVDIVRMAASYTAAIVQNQPFFDGNKRTGFVIGILFLELNGRHFRASEAHAAQAVIALAAGRLDEYGFAAFLRANVG